MEIGINQGEHTDAWEYLIRPLFERISQDRLIIGDVGDEICPFPFSNSGSGSRIRTWVLGVMEFDVPKYYHFLRLVSIRPNGVKDDISKLSPVISNE